MDDNEDLENSFEQQEIDRMEEPIRKRGRPKKVLADVQTAKCRGRPRKNAELFVRLDATSV